MISTPLKALALASMLTFASGAALAQNVAIVNGKAVPKTRLDALATQIERAGRPVTPEMQGQLREEVIAREIFMQEADKQGLAQTDDFRNQMELARQSILIRELFSQYQKKNPVTDAEMKAEYDKFVAANSGKEYKARHKAVQGPRLRRQWGRPRLGRTRQLRARVQPGTDQTQQGPNHRRPGQDPVRLAHHSP